MKVGLNLSYCQSCGKDVEEGDTFCPHCGAAVTPTKGEPVTYRRGYQDERKAWFGQDDGKACFGPAGSGAGLWGAISGGIFLVGLAALWYYDFWWPGILFLIALMAIIGGIVSYTRR